MALRKTRSCHQNCLLSFPADGELITSQIRARLDSEDSQFEGRQKCEYGYILTDWVGFHYSRPKMDYLKRIPHDMCHVVASSRSLHVDSPDGAASGFKKWFSSIWRNKIVSLIYWDLNTEVIVFFCSKSAFLITTPVTLIELLKLPHIFCDVNLTLCKLRVLVSVVSRRKHEVTHTTKHTLKKKDCPVLRISMLSFFFRNFQLCLSTQNDKVECNHTE